MAHGSASPPSDTGAVRRLVVLGASNVARGLGRLLRLAAQRSAGPLEAWIAGGHGRSYGQNSAVLMRRLPGIVRSRLWTELELAPPLPTWALLTDVGNDLLYDVPAPQIAESVAACLDRLAQHRARVCVGLLPLCNLAALPQWRYRLYRQLFFPGCRLSLAEVAQRAGILQELLRDLAVRHQASIVEPQPRWYGHDPIHIRRSRLTEAWLELTSSWSIETSDSQLAAERLAWPLPAWRLPLLPPAERWFWGLQRRATQPCWQSPAGWQLRLY